MYGEGRGCKCEREQTFKTVEGKPREDYFIGGNCEKKSYHLCQILNGNYTAYIRNWKIVTLRKKHY